jgi:hypothetical protein
MLILVHHPDSYRQLGRLVGQGSKTEIKHALADYLKLLTAALKHKPTIKKNVNVLQHLLGYFKKDLSRGRKTGISGNTGSLLPGPGSLNRAANHDQSLCPEIPSTVSGPTILSQSPSA